jgi:hypothetical protein
MNQTITTSYNVFLTQKNTKELITEILDGVLSYDINNNVARIDILKDEPSKMEEVKSAFFRALVELDIVDTSYVSSKTVDSYLYYLLRNGSIEFVFYNNKYYLKNSTNEHITSGKNFGIELLVNGEAYLKGLHKTWNPENGYVLDTTIVNSLKKKLIELLDVAIKNNLNIKKKDTWFTRLLTFLKIRSVFSYKYRIVLNDKQTLVNDMEHLEKGFQETFKEAIDQVERSAHGEKEITE